MGAATTMVYGKEVSYLEIGEGDSLVVILHGWPSHKGTWEHVARDLAGAEYRIIAPDFPGFGNSEEPPEAWGIREYAEWTRDFVSTVTSQLSMGDTNPTVIGHSFGGRVAIELAGGAPSFAVNRLVLIAPSGVRHEPAPAWKRISTVGNAIFSLPVLCAIKPLARKMLHRVFLRRSIYYDTEGIMRESFKKVINEEGEQLEQLLQHITVPTLLLWGSDDATVPPADGEYMAQNIPGAHLQRIAGAGHSPQKEQPETVARHIRTFIGETA